VRAPDNCPFAGRDLPLRDSSVSHLCWEIAVRGKDILPSPYVAGQISPKKCGRAIVFTATSWAKFLI
jgi:hypothetical protein